MIRNFIICIIFVVSMGCSTMVDLTVQSIAGAIGGALGNMADRRVEEKLGNDTGVADEKLEPKLKKEKDNECKDCEPDKR